MVFRTLELMHRAGISTGMLQLPIRGDFDMGDIGSFSSSASTIECFPSSFSCFSFSHLLTDLVIFSGKSATFNGRTIWPIAIALVILLLDLLAIGYLWNLRLECLVRNVKHHWGRFARFLIGNVIAIRYFPPICRFRLYGKMEVYRPAFAVWAICPNAMVPIRAKYPLWWILANSLCSVYDLWFVKCRPNYSRAGGTRGRLSELGMSSPSPTDSRNCGI